MEILESSRVPSVTMKTPVGSLCCAPNSPLRNRRGAGNVSPSTCLPTMEKALDSIPALYKLGSMVHACNRNTEVLEAGGSKLKVLQGHPQPHLKRPRPVWTTIDSLKTKGWGEGEGDRDSEWKTGRRMEGPEGASVELSTDT